MQQEQEREGTVCTASVFQAADSSLLQAYQSHTWVGSQARLGSRPGPLSVYGQLCHCPGLDVFLVISFPGTNSSSRVSPALQTC